MSEEDDIGLPSYPNANKRLLPYSKAHRLLTRVQTSLPSYSISDRLLTRREASICLPTRWQTASLLECGPPPTSKAHRLLSRKHTASLPVSDIRCRRRTPSVSLLTRMQTRRLLAYSKAHRLLTRVHTCPPSYPISHRLLTRREANKCLPTRRRSASLLECEPPPTSYSHRLPSRKHTASLLEWRRDTMSWD